MSTISQQTSEELLGACIEALALFDNYPQCYEAVGTLQRLLNAVDKGFEEKNFPTIQNNA